MIMHRKLFIAVMAVVGGIAVVTSCSEQPNNVRNSESRPQISENFETLLDSLVVSIPDGPLSDADRRVLSERRKEQHQAEAKLRELGTNVLPQLMQKVEALGRVEATNRAAARVDTRRLARAFEILGDKAIPLLPMLTNELHRGQSIGPSMAGLVGIGGSQAGLALIPELTNSDSTIRNWTMSALSYFSTNREVVAVAVPLVLPYLHDDSAFTRSLTANLLGQFHTNAEAVLPQLAELAEHDQDIVVRISAIKSIGRFGTNAASMKAVLEKIAATSQEQSIRSMTYNALQAARGEIPPDAIR